MISYNIIETRFSVNPDGTPGRIDLVLWNATKNQETLSATLSGRGTRIPGDYSPADKPYQDVTELDCIDWVIDLEDQTSIEAQLDARIAELAQPTVSTGRPWQEAYPLWAVGVAVSVGDIRIYENTGYECIQAHTTQAQWAPPVTPALWKFYVPISEGPQPWVQPLGSEDAYGDGVQVTHQPAEFTEVHLWTSLVAANVWEPTPANSTLWEDNGPF